jgi:phosphocarrier protein HPr
MSRMESAAQTGRALAQQLTIVNRKGLHARASARFVRTAECFEAEIKVTRDGTTVAGNSIMGLMMLGAGPGSTILVQASGKQAREALDAITVLVATASTKIRKGRPRTDVRRVLFRSPLRTITMSFEQRPGTQPGALSCAEVGRDIKKALCPG